MDHHPARVLLAVTWVAATSAFAGWDPVTVSGTTLDAHIASETSYVIITDTGAYEFDATTATGNFQTATGVRGGAARGNGCVMSLDNGGNVRWSTAACGTNHPALTISGTRRLRHTGAFTAYATSFTAGVGSQARYSPSGGAANDWVNLSGFLSAVWTVNEALSVLRVGTTDYALIGLAGVENLIVVTGTSVGPAVNTGLGIIDELELFGTTAPPGALAIGTSGAVQRIPDVTAPTVTEAINLGAGIIAKGVAFSVGTGDATSGDGFGFISAIDSGGVAKLFSAVPDPAAPGVAWVESTQAPAGVLFDRITCLGATMCVGVTRTATAGTSAYLYRNLAAPAVSVVTPEPTIDEGQSVEVTVSASDSDGDAPWITWPSSTSPFTITPLSATTARFTAAPGTGLVCGTTPVSFDYTVKAGDGLLGHVGTGTVRVNVRHTVPPVAPSVGRGTALITSLLGSDTVVAGRGASGCTPTSFEWALTSGPALDVTLGSSGTSATFRPVLGDCAPTNTSSTYAVTARDDAGASASATNVTVHVQAPGLPPSTPTVDRPSVSITSLVGAETITASPGPGPGCAPTQYSWTRASGPELQVVLDATGAKATFRPILTACDSASFTSEYDVVATHGGGSSSAERVSVSVQAPALPAGIASFSSETVAASCGAGAQGVIRAVPAPDQCPGSQISWKQIAGPALEQPTQGPGELQITTAEKGLDALIGEELVFEVTANGGVGNVSTREARFKVVPAEPFIAVRHGTDPPIAREGGILGIAVDLTNTSDCPISSASFRESLAGTDYIEGSARFDGGPVEVAVEGDALVVSGLALPGRGTGRFTYLARPRLLDAPRPEGQVFVRGVPVSQAAGLEPGSSRCGCSGAGEGSFGLALLLVSAWVTRRRAQRP